MPADLHDPAVRRRLYITLANKRAHPGSGSGPEILWARTWRRPVFDLKELVTVPFVVVGGVATRLYAPERMTDDLDVLIEKDMAEQFYEELNVAGCLSLGRLAVGGSSWRLPDGTPLDVLEGDEEWTVEAVEHPIIGPNGFSIIAMPYLILMKMRASRGIDIGDLTRILGAANEIDLTKTRQVINKYLADADEDLESLIQLGRLEYQGTEVPE
jgi:hypothetical protein